MAAPYAPGLQSSRPDMANSGASFADPEGAAEARAEPPAGPSHSGSGVSQQSAQRSLQVGIQAAQSFIVTRMLSPSANTPAVTPSSRLQAHHTSTMVGAAMSPSANLKAKRFTAFQHALPGIASAEDVESLSGREQHPSAAGDLPRQGYLPSSLASSLDSTLGGKGMQALATGVRTLLSAAEQQLVRRRVGAHDSDGALGPYASPTKMDAESGDWGGWRAEPEKKGLPVMARHGAFMSGGRRLTKQIRTAMRRRGIESPWFAVTVAAAVVLLVLFLRRGPSIVDSSPANVEVPVVIESAPEVVPPLVAAPQAAQHPVFHQEQPSLGPTLAPKLAEHTKATLAAPVAEHHDAGSTTVINTAPAKHDHKCHTNVPIFNEKTNKSYVYCTAEALTWDEANESARASGGLLAEIRSPQERNFILREILWPCYDEHVFIETKENHEKSKGGGGHAMPHSHGGAATVVTKKIGPMTGAHSVSQAFYEQTRRSIAASRNQEYKTEAEKHPPMVIASGDKLHEHEHDHLAAPQLYPYGTFMWAGSGAPVPLPDEGHAGGSWPIDAVSPHGVPLHPQHRTTKGSEGNEITKEEPEDRYTIAWAVVDTENHSHMGAEDELEMAWTILPIINAEKDIKADHTSSDDTASHGHGRYFFLVESSSSSGELDLSQVCKRAVISPSSSKFVSPSNPSSAGSAAHGGLLGAIEKVADAVEDGFKGLKRKIKRKDASNSESGL